MKELNQEELDKITRDLAGHIQTKIFNGTIDSNLKVEEAKNAKKKLLDELREMLAHNERIKEIQKQKEPESWRVVFQDGGISAIENIIRMVEQINF